jgi:hypothetical protein
MLSKEELRQAFSQISESRDCDFPAIDKETKEIIKTEFLAAGYDVDQLTQPESIGESNIHSEILDEIHAWFVKRGHEMPSAHVGFFNQGPLVAEMRNLFGSGAIVTYNIGLSDFIYQSFKAISFCVADGDPPTQPTITKEQCANYLVYLATETSRHKDPRYAQGLQVPGKDHIELTMALTLGAFRFVMAHELAHLLDDPNNSDSIQREFDADLKAQEHIVENFLENQNRDFYSSVALQAPLHFFELIFLFRVVDALREGQTEIHYHDHPPDLDRRDVLYDNLMSISGDQKDLFFRRYAEFASPIAMAVENFLEMVSEITAFKPEMMRIICEGFDECGVPILLGLTEKSINRQFEDGGTKVKVSRGGAEQ